MTALSREVQPFGRHKVAAPAALKSGQPFAVSGYPTMILGQIKPAESGDKVTGFSSGTYAFRKASATTASSGDTAYWHEANELVVTSSGAGIITLGKFRGDAVNGKTVCNVELNGA
jgi:predicted RecA/RadA family phage recombinase